jgi:hypothetical protein
MPGVTVTFRHRSTNPEAGIAIKEKSAKGTAFTTRAFCRDCNGGWMADLEDEVKPVLEPMLHGRPILLDEHGKAVLSFWAMKTILAFQAVEAKETTFARPEDFRAFYEARAALAGSEIWLGAVSAGGEAFYRGHSARLPDSEASAVDGFGATLIVGHAAFYLLHGYERSFGLRIRRSLADALRRIHPPAPGGQSWPPPRLLEYDPESGLAGLVMNNSMLEKASGGSPLTGPGAGAKDGR